MKASIKRYLSNYSGFSRSLWLLAGVTFIHRAGTMVLPFLSQYLNHERAFDKSQIGTLLMYYGLGAIGGALIGGRLTDLIGYRRVIPISLIWSGLAFFTLQYLTDFTSLSIGFFALTFIAEAFRPALYVAVADYAEEQQHTRALTLVRLAINLGVSIGPAIAGLIVIQWGYVNLFKADAVACIAAAVFFLLLPKAAPQQQRENSENDKATPKELWAAFSYLAPFLFTVFTTSLLFFQLYHVMPLYHTEVVGLNPGHTGFLMTVNGLLICLFELPLVTYFDRLQTPKIKLILFGTALFTIAFASLFLGASWEVLLLMMVIITFGVMFCSPFSNALVLEKAPKGYTGFCLGAYTMCIGLANVVSSKVSLEIVHRWGYTTNFSLMLGIGFISCCILIGMRMTNKR